MTAPDHLTKASKALWEGIAKDYAICDQAGLLLLTAMAEAYDRMKAAQKAIARDGDTFKDRFGQIKAHPSITVERDCRAAMLQALKHLRLDIEIGD